MRYCAALLILFALFGPPLRAESKPFFFLQFSDPQFGFFNQNKDFEQETVNFEFAIATANRLKPAFVIITGDLVNKTGDPAQIAEYLRITKKLDPAIHLYNVAGNHDLGNIPTPRSIAAYTEKFGPDHYTFHEGDLTGIVLNSPLIYAPAQAMDLYNAQQVWLKTELAKARPGGGAGGAGVKHLAIFEHHPYFLESADEKDQYFNMPRERRLPYLQLFHDAGVSHIFAGHLHEPREARDGNLDMVITGATGRPLNKSRSGLRLVAVRDAGLTHRWYELGEVPNKIDRATWPNSEMLKDKGAAPATKPARQR